MHDLILKLKFISAWFLICWFEKIIEISYLIIFDYIWHKDKILGEKNSKKRVYMLIIFGGQNYAPMQNGI